jgi:hypothetical protein
MSAITTDNAQLILLFGWAQDEGCQLLLATQINLKLIWEHKLSIAGVRIGKINVYIIRVNGGGKLRNRIPTITIHPASIAP